MNTISILAQATEIAAAAWDAADAQAPNLIVACGNCGGTGAVRFHWGRGMFDYNEETCRSCDEGDVVIPNPAYRAA